MSTKINLQWLRLITALTLLLAGLTLVTPARADACVVTNSADNGAAQAIGAGNIVVHKSK